MTQRQDTQPIISKQQCLLPPSPTDATGIFGSARPNDYILDIDCFTGHYQLLTLTGDKVRRLASDETYDSALRRAAKAHVSPEYRQEFSENFNVCDLLSAFAKGAGSVELEYKWVNSDSSLRWKKNLAFPYTMENGALHILIYVRDITQIKATELQRLEDEANYVFALQSMYEEIYHIQLETGTITSIYLDGAQMASGSAFDLEGFIAHRVRHRVDPDYVPTFLEAYNKEQLWQCAREGKVLEMEYRRSKEDDLEYRWIAATMLPGLRQNSLLLFLRDVTRLKEAENNFYNALRNNYGDIFTIDATNDSMRFVAANTDISRNMLLPGEFFSKNIAAISERSVHPDDKEGFLAFFNLDNLLRGIQGTQKVSHEHRLRSTGPYIWYEAIALPMPGAMRGEILVLCQDIDDRKLLESTKYHLEQRNNAIFRQTCDVMLEVRLDTGHYKQTIFGQSKVNISNEGHFDEVYAEIEQHIHPEDKQHFVEERHLTRLREACAQHELLPACEYRLRYAKEEHWVESRVFFIEDEDGTTACILARDISAQKKVEEARDAENQRLNIALRGSYSEIYELNTVEETAKLLFSSHQSLVPVDDVSTADPISRLHIINTFVHPADREKLWEDINGYILREAFGHGEYEVNTEFRRRTHDGGYVWLAGTALPVREAQPLGSKALFFLKDISQRKKKEEQDRVLEQYGQALRNIYDFFYEFSFTHDTYKLVHHAHNKFVTPEPTGSLSHLMQHKVPSVMHPEDLQGLQLFFDAESIRADFAKGNKHRMGEFRARHINGEFQWTAFTMFPVVNEDGEEAFLLFGLDIHAYKEAEEMARRNLRLEQQRIADERYRIVVQQTDTMIFEWKSQDDSRYVSPQLQERFAGDYDGRDILQVWEEDSVLHPEELAILKEFRNLKTHSLRREMTVRLLQRQGGFLWCKVAIASLTDENGHEYHRIGTLNDVDEATRASHALRQRAERDQLTGVYNMRTFYAKAVEMMRQFPSRNYAILRMDIDDFKMVNDLYGMEEGDILLKKIGRTLQSLMVGHCVCGRISADVFCACVDFDDEGMVALVETMTNALSNYPLTGSVHPSFGICRVEHISTPINVLCDWANLALKTVKGNTLISYAFYDGSLRDTFLKEKRIKGEMHQALLQGQFQLYLQPKVHMPDDTVMGAEGLVRWKHPVEGLIAPDEFIPLFEKNGFIIPLDEYIWEESCKLLRSWMDRGLPVVPLSVNVSRLHIQDSSLCDTLAGLLKKYNVPAHLLELELTESIFLDSKKQSLDGIMALRQQGFRFALDDFGAGFSSLSMLKSLPVECLKIDKGFFDEVLDTERGQTIIRHVISLARDMNMSVIAEGVESHAQAQFLCQNGCTLAQGYHYSRPITVAEFESKVFGIASYEKKTPKSQKIMDMDSIPPLV